MPSSKAVYWFDGAPVVDVQDRGPLYWIDGAPVGVYDLIDATAAATLPMLTATGTGTAVYHSSATLGPTFARRLRRGGSESSSTGTRTKKRSRGRR